jgi:hypothetical protein
MVGPARNDGKKKAKPKYSNSDGIRFTACRFW